MTKAMPFLQKAILLSYDPRPFCRGLFCALTISWVRRYNEAPKARRRKTYEKHRD